MSGLIRLSLAEKLYLQRIEQTSAFWRSMKGCVGICSIDMVLEGDPNLRKLGPICPKKMCEINL